MHCQDDSSRSALWVIFLGETKFLQFSQSFLMNSIAQMAAHLHDMGDVLMIWRYTNIHGKDQGCAIKDELGKDFWLG